MGHEMLEPRLEGRYRLEAQRARLISHRFLWPRLIVYIISSHLPHGFEAHGIRITSYVPVQETV